MEYQFLPNTPIDDADIIIVPIAYGESVSAKDGTQEAPEAILQATQQLEYYEEDLEWSPMKFMKICVVDALKSYADIERFYPLDLEKKLLLSLGGDHSITPKITKELLSKPSTILFLDAHADLRESYLGSKESHATPAYQLLEQGHKMLMVGIRSLFESEAQRVKSDKNIEFYSDRALQKSSTKEKLLDSISHLEGDIYLSIDMDVFNPAFVPSVGTPQPGGMDWYFANDIIEQLFLNKKINLKGVDMVELIPEASQVSQVFTAKLLQKIISHWGKSQEFHKKEMLGSQMEVHYE